MYRQETARLHAIARSPGFRLVPTDHSEQRMVERDIARFDVERMLKAAPVVMIDREPDGTETWRVAGHDKQGRIEAVIEIVPPSIVVLVTVIRPS
jgi:hypothetical protein